MQNYSVIIPTFNRSSMLKKSLMAVTRINYPKKNFEIIVVDNNSTDNTKSVVSEIIKNYDVSLRYVFEPKQGLVFSRHAGATNSKYKTLVFIDDDIIVGNNWLKEIDKVYNIDKDVVAVAGKINIKWDASPPNWVSRYEYLLGKLNYGDDVLINKFIYINGGNFSIKKQTLVDLGGFNPDQIGNYLIGDGESGLCEKIHYNKLSIGWSPGAVVDHYQKVKVNGTVLDIERRFANYAVSKTYSLYLKHGSNPLCLIDQILISFVSFVFFSVVKKFSRVNTNLYYDCTFNVSFNISVCTYALKILTDNNFRKQIAEIGLKKNL